jgi:hypothetical protein
MIVARTTVEETFDSSRKLKRRIATVKQYQGTSNSERDPQGGTSGQPPAPPHKEAPNRRGEGQKKVKTGKPNK